MRDDDDRPPDQVGYTVTSSTDGYVWLEIRSTVSWAQLRTDEARQLAADLLLHAHAIDGRGPVLEVREGT